MWKREYRGMSMDEPNILIYYAHSYTEYCIMIRDICIEEGENIQWGN